MCSPLIGIGTLDICRVLEYSVLVFLLLNTHFNRYFIRTHVLKYRSHISEKTILSQYCLNWYWYIRRLLCTGFLLKF